VFSERRRSVCDGVRSIRGFPLHYTAPDLGTPTSLVYTCYSCIYLDVPAEGSFTLFSLDLLLGVLYI